MIFKWNNEGLSNREIGMKLRRVHTSISRELNRHSKYLNEYVPCKAHANAQNILIKQRSKARLKNPTIYLYVRTKLREGLSPEQISGKLSQDHLGESIHHETIYRYIYSKDGIKEKLYQYLLYHRKKRMKHYGRKITSEKLLNKLPIEKRPSIVNTRRTYGHWETDNVEGVRSVKYPFFCTVRLGTLV